MGRGREGREEGEVGKWMWMPRLTCLVGHDVDVVKQQILLSQELLDHVAHPLVSDEWWREG